MIKLNSIGLFAFLKTLSMRWVTASWVSGSPSLSIQCMPADGQSYFSCQWLRMCVLVEDLDMYFIQQLVIYQRGLTSYQLHSRHHQHSLPSFVVYYWPLAGSITKPFCWICFLLNIVLPWMAVVSDAEKSGEWLLLPNMGIMSIFGALLRRLELSTEITGSSNSSQSIPAIINEMGVNGGASGRLPI
jgi:hypothetical protein